MAGLIEKISKIPTGKIKSFKALVGRGAASACLFLLVGIGFFTFPHEAHAEWWNPFSWASDIAQGVAGQIVEGMAALVVTALAWIIYVFVKIASYLLYVAGAIFNYALIELVFEYAQNFGNSSAVLAGWNVIRDFGNIALLFGFIFIGIATILNIQNYTAKKTLVRLLLFAILVNFSLFTASLIVDVSNTFSYVFYNQAAASGCADMSDQECATSRGLAAKIISLTGTGNLSLQGNPGITVDFDVSMRNLFAQIVMLTFIIVLMVVLLTAAIMFIIRGVVLTFLIITSPVGFVGMVVPFLGSLANEWWNKLISQSFFAPLYLLLILVALKIMEGVVEATGTLSLMQALTNPNSTLMGNVVMGIMIIAFLVAALIMSKKIGAIGADMAIGAAGKATGFAVAAPAAFVGRNVVGRSATALAPKLARVPLVGGALARNLDKLGNKSFDLRGIKQLQEAGKAAGGISLGSAGKAAQGGYRGLEAASKERDEKVRKIRRAGVDVSKEEDRIRDSYDKLLNLEKELARTRRDAAEEAARLGLRGEEADSFVADAVNRRAPERELLMADIAKNKKAMKNKRGLEDQEYARDLMRQANNPFGLYALASPAAKRELADEIRNSWDIDGNLDPRDKDIAALIKGLKEIAPEFRGDEH